MGQLGYTMDITKAMPELRLRTNLDNDYERLMQCVVKEFAEAPGLSDKIAKIKHHWIRGEAIPRYALDVINGVSSTRRDSLKRFLLSRSRIMMTGTLKTLLINRGLRTAVGAFTCTFAQEFIASMVDPMQCSITNAQIEYLRSTGVKLMSTKTFNLKTLNLPVYHDVDRGLPIEMPERYIKLNGRLVGDKRVTDTNLPEYVVSTHGTHINTGDTFFLDLGNRTFVASRLYDNEGNPVDTIDKDSNGVVVTTQCGVNLNAVLLP